MRKSTLLARICALVQFSRTLKASYIFWTLSSMKMDREANHSSLPPPPRIYVRIKRRMTDSGALSRDTPG